MHSQKLDDFEDALDELKDRIEQATISGTRDVTQVADLQVEVGAFTEVLRDRCDTDRSNDALQVFKSDFKNWAGGHLPYVMVLRDEFIAQKTVLMQTV